MTAHETRGAFRGSARGLLAGVVAGGMLVAVPGRADAQAGRHAVLIQGASGEPQYATLHRGWLDRLSTVLKEEFKFEPATVTVLAERPSAGETRATAEAVREVFGRLASTVTPEDLVFVMMIGHGSGVGADAKFNLVGPDLTAGDWKALIEPLGGRLVLVDATSASFGFLQTLAAPGRVVITATNTPAQRYHTVFPDAFIDALSAKAADQDQNGRISMLEAFTYASRLVAQHYEQAGTMATETSVLDDTGAGTGRRAGEDGQDGAVAEATYLDVVAVATSADPEVQKLLTRQRELTDALDALKRRRTSMTAEEYDREFERLATELAVVSREIRRRGGSGVPPLDAHAFASPDEIHEREAGQEASGVRPKGDPA